MIKRKNMILPGISKGIIQGLAANRDLRQVEHNNDLIMSTVASQITGGPIVCSTVGSGADERKHQSSASLAFVRGIHRGSVNFPHKGPVKRKINPFDDVIMNISSSLVVRIWILHSFALHHTIIWRIVCFFVGIVVRLTYATKRIKITQNEKKPCGMSFVRFLFFLYLMANTMQQDSSWAEFMTSWNTISSCHYY